MVEVVGLFRFSLVILCTSFQYPLCHICEITISYWKMHDQIIGLMVPVLEYRILYNSLNNKLVPNCVF